MVGDCIFVRTLFPLVHPIIYIFVTNWKEEVGGSTKFVSEHCGISKRSEMEEDESCGCKLDA
jgi:hypothetical protein